MIRKAFADFHRSCCTDHVQPRERTTRPGRKTPAEDRADVAFADVFQHALFQGAVRPGDELTLVAKSIENSDYVSVCAGQALLGEQVQALAIYEVFMLDDEG